jgi:hypothetical protein
MDQITEWADYSTREPFGFPGDDLLNAFSAFVSATAAGAKDVDPMTFLLSERLSEGAPLEDGGVADDALVGRLEKLLPPKPVSGLPTEGE